MAASRRVVLLWIERLALIGGLVCGVWAFTDWWQARSAQQQMKEDLQRVLATAPPAGPAAALGSAVPDTIGTTAGVPDAPRVATGEPLVATLEIPRVGLSVAMLEGDDDGTLSRGAGHLPDTPLPWEPGNSAFAGHRDSFFRPLRNVRVGDTVQIVSRNGTIEYEVRSLKIVQPDDVWVLKPQEHEGLTLITCYPFDFVGSAPDRFIVQAERVSTD